MTKEIVKKTKAPAKSKTESVVKATPAVAAKKTVKAAPRAKAIEVATPSAPSYGEIAQLAERFWAERGWQDGYAEQDWLRAEHELVGAAL